MSEATGEGLAMLLANHGMVACGPSLSKAFNVAENVEWVAEIQWRTMCVGKPAVLSKEEIDVVIESFKTVWQVEEGATRQGRILIKTRLSAFHHQEALY